MQYLSSNLTKT